MTPGAMAERPVVWLIDGDDPVLVSEAAKATIDDLVGDSERSLVVEDFGAEESGLAAVADAASTPPFLSDRRVVVVRDVGRFVTADLGPLLSYLEAPLATTSVVLVVGASRPAPRLVSAVKAHGHVRSTAVTARTAKAFLAERVKASSLRLDGRAEALIAAHLGEDVSRLGALLEVLGAVFGAGAHLGPDDISPYLGEAGSLAPWDLTDAIDSGATELALEVLHRLLDAGARHPLVVHAIIARHVGSLLRVDSPEITTEAQAAQAMGIASGRSTFPAKKALTSARHYGSQRIAQAVDLAARAEVALKGGRGSLPSELVLEVLVARLCRLARSRTSRHAAARPVRGAVRRR